MRILTDIDDTLNDMGHVLLKWLNEDSSLEYKYSDITTWDWYKNVFGEKWYKPLNDPLFWLEVNIDNKAIQVLENLVKQGHDVKLVSASFLNDVLIDKIYFTLFPFDDTLINENNIIITQDKSCIKGDLMIDDKPDNLVNFEGIKFLYDQPWNRKEKEIWDLVNGDFVNYARVSNWNQIEQLLKLYL